MFRLITICVIAVSTTFVGHLAARGRSFPIQVIGTIIGFNRTSQMFTIRVDEPAHVLTITVGRDCKFKRHGAPAGEQILKPGARVKVSYFATIFTGNIAVEIELDPVPKYKRVSIENSVPPNRKQVPRSKARTNSRTSEAAAKSDEHIVIRRATCQSEERIRVLLKGLKIGNPPIIRHSAFHRHAITLYFVYFWARSALASRSSGRSSSARSQMASSLA
jgi:hypothetical protein